MPRLIVAALLLLLSAPNLARAQGPRVGDVVDYTFTRPLGNAKGVSSLSDLRGRPVLIEFWEPT